VAPEISATFALHGYLQQTISVRQEPNSIALSATNYPWPNPPSAK